MSSGGLLSTIREAPGNAFAGLGRLIRRYTPEEYHNYIHRMYGGLRNDYERHRKPEPAPAPPVPSENEPLKINMVEWHAKDNAKEHNTSKYELVRLKPATPILRRGQGFYLAIRTEERNYDLKKDAIKLVFTFGPHPNVIKGTQIELDVSEESEFTQGVKAWDIRTHHHEENILTLHVRIPASVCVGIWKCKIITSLSEDKTKKITFDCKENIYILFNPWCKEDAVFMDNDVWRKEYVLNDTGKVYVGSHKQAWGRRWVFGQYDDVVLPACMYILEISKIDFTARGNVVKVVRAISAAVNSIDEDGILEGNWSGNYEDGTSPSEWTGSVKILEEYMNSGGKSVKYGQCWVFSGITTTICRALGIPCRSVTNFISAHDTDESLSVDVIFDKEGNVDKDFTSDSMWNFHVWNDVWMARPDLPSGYGGWQAIDATPQEQSEDIYQAGPASVVAVRRGEIGLLYDTPFVFAEVNADVIHWQNDSEAALGFRKLRTNNYHVGRRILTKRPGVDDDEGDEDTDNILEEYKDPEGTEAERMAVLNAARCGGLQHIYDIPTLESSDVSFDLVEIDRITIGDPFNVNVKIENKSDQVRTVYAVLSTSSVYYTGVQAKRVKKIDGNFTLQPQQTEMLGIRITVDEYLDKLVDYSMMKIYAIAVVKETRQTWTEEDDFAVDKPKINIETEGEAKVGQPINVICSFTNPLDRVLTDCKFSFEGPGITRPKTVAYGNIQPKETVRKVEELKPLRKGKRKLVIAFTSNMLSDITGSRDIEITK